MSDKKRFRSDDNDELLTETPAPAPPPCAQLSVEDVNKLAEDVNGHYDILLGWLSNEKGTERKDKLRAAIIAFTATFNKISNAYFALLASFNTANLLNDSVERIRLDAARITESIGKQVLAKPQDIQAVSYAEVASRLNAHNSTEMSPRNNARVGGRSVPIKPTKRVIVGPRDDAKNLFKSSSDTKSTLLKAVNPASLKMKVNRISLSPNSTLTIEGELDSKTLQNCESLATSGLEVKPYVKQNPRLILHDIPVHMTFADIARCLVEQNFPTASQDEFTSIYMYPEGEKK